MAALIVKVKKGKRRREKKKLKGNTKEWPGYRGRI
jgi:hypothetical protein